MTNSTTSLSAIQQRVWDGKLLLEIVLDPSECRTFDESDPYLVSFFHTKKHDFIVDLIVPPPLGYFFVLYFQLRAKKF